jgi:L-asparagine transporter-like permease
MIALAGTIGTVSFHSQILVLTNKTRDLQGLFLGLGAAIALAGYVM